MCGTRKKGTMRLGMGATLAIALVGLADISRAAAAETSLVARLDTTVDSFFTLDFGDFGGLREALISSTAYELRIDAHAQTARFVRYRQDIDPIVLPVGPEGLSTGDIRVEIVPGSSSGVYDSETGQFTTSETYAVYFDADLSGLGLTSPFLLPATSTGTIYFDTAWTGDIVMEWAGGGILADLLPFEYTCSVYATFAPQKVRQESTPATPVPDDGEGSGE